MDAGQVVVVLPETLQVSPPTVGILGFIFPRIQHRDTATIKK